MGSTKYLIIVIDLLLINPELQTQDSTGHAFGKMYRESKRDERLQK
jgi:hypothetical protein